MRISLTEKGAPERSGLAFERVLSLKLGPTMGMRLAEIGCARKISGEPYDNGAEFSLHHTLITHLRANNFRQNPASSVYLSRPASPTTIRPLRVNTSQRSPDPSPRANIVSRSVLFSTRIPPASADRNRISPFTLSTLITPENVSGTYTITSPVRMSAYDREKVERSTGRLRTPPMTKDMKSGISKSQVISSYQAEADEEAISEDFLAADSSLRLLFTP